MALRRDIDEYLNWSFEQVVDLIVRQKEFIEDLEDKITERDDLLAERDDYIRNLLEAN